MSFSQIVEQPVKKVDNYKTYITMILAATIGIVQDAGIWTMPTWGWILLTLAFGGSVRSAWKKMQK